MAMGSFPFPAVPVPGERGRAPAPPQSQTTGALPEPGAKQRPEEPRDPDQAPEGTGWLWGGVRPAIPQSGGSFSGCLRPRSRPCRRVGSRGALGRESGAPSAASPP